MSAVKHPLKAFQTERLCLVFEPQRLHHIEPHLFPLERDPTRFVFMDGMNSVPGFLGAARLQKSPGYFGRNSWHCPRIFALLRDECINVTLGVCNFLQRQADGALVSATGNFIGIEGPAATPANHLTIFVLLPFWRNRRHFEKSPF